VAAALGNAAAGVEPVGETAGVGVAVGVQSHEREQLVEAGAVAEALGAAKEATLDLAQGGFDGPDRVRAAPGARPSLAGDVGAVLVEPAH
jgi:hypothetical protein